MDGMNVSGEARNSINSSIVNGVDKSITRRCPLKDSVSQRAGQFQSVDEKGLTANMKLMYRC